MRGVLMETVDYPAIGTISRAACRDWMAGNNFCAASSVAYLAGLSNSYMSGVGHKLGDIFCLLHSRAVSDSDELEPLDRVIPTAIDVYGEWTRGFVCAYGAGQHEIRTAMLLFAAYAMRRSEFFAAYLAMRNNPFWQPRWIPPTAVGRATNAQEGQQTVFAEHVGDPWWSWNPANEVPGTLFNAPYIGDSGQARMRPKRLWRDVQTTVKPAVNPTRAKTVLLQVFMSHTTNIRVALRSPAASGRAPETKQPGGSGPSASDRRQWLHGEAARERPDGSPMSSTRLFRESASRGLDGKFRLWLGCFRLYKHLPARLVQTLSRRLVALLLRPTHKTIGQGQSIRSRTCRSPCEWP